MAVIEKSQLLELLEGKSQKDWIDALDAIADAMHPVDRDATRIWFAFWPLELNEALAAPEGADEMARIMDLEGKWKLAEQIDSSVAFLHGAHHWAPVKRAILSHERGGSLADVIRDVASKVAESERVDAGLVHGITAVGLMTLRQVGFEALQRTADAPAGGELLPKNPERVVSRRMRESRDGLFTSLKGVNRKWDVRWNERSRNGTFRAITGQDIAMAGAAADGDYRSLDYRRIDGPVPVECRIGSCGYCWIGLLGGREKLSEIGNFERERLRYFGYDTVNAEDDKHPLIRLACQSQCHGDVTLAIAPWNGELNRRHDEERKKLGTA